jgi:hypothetical protein
VSKLTLDAHHFAFLAQRFARLAAAHDARARADANGTRHGARSEATSEASEATGARLPDLTAPAQVAGEPASRLAALFAARAGAFGEVAAVWGAAARALGRSTAADAAFVYPLRRRDRALRVALQGATSLGRRSASRDRYRASLATVARRFGRLLFAAHAPALRPAQPRTSGGVVLGAWAAAPAAAAVDSALLAERLAVVDGAFSPAMLAALRRMCDETTAFFDSKAGYHGGYLGDGLAAGAALQAAAALKAALPNTLGRLVLSQIWAYKCARASFVSCAVLLSLCRMSLRYSSRFRMKNLRFVSLFDDPIFHSALPQIRLSGCSRHSPPR